MDIDSMTIGDARRLASMFSGQPAAAPAPGHPWEVGKNYFIRTVTHHLTGRLVAVAEHELVLEDAAWIADDGRFAQAIEKGEFAEVEPFPSGRRVIVGRAALIDATDVPTLPRSRK